MKISNAYPSEFLKAEDLQGGRYTMTISHVTMEKVSETENKPVLHFHNAQKGMVLNKTNSMNVSILYGDETDTWTGKQIELFTTMVPFQGRNVPAIRITAPPGQPVQQQPAMPDGRPTIPATSSMGGPVPEAAAQATGIDEDEVPF